MSSKIRFNALVRGSFALLGASALAGCSSDSQRFQSLYASVQPQQAQPVALANQTMPGVDTSISTGSIGRAGVRPMMDVGQGGLVQQAARQSGQQLLPPPTYNSQLSNSTSAVPIAVSRNTALAPITPARRAVEPIAMPKPKLVAALPAKSNALVDPVETGSVQAVSTPKMATQNAGGWSHVNGTKITMREGETVYNLSRRFGVPASEILRVNGIDKAGSVQTGQVLIIPTYQYSADNPISAPDNNAQTAIAKASTGTIFDVPANKIPAPTQRPDNKYAVLPTIAQPKSKSTDKMATGAIASQVPVDETEQATAKLGPVDQPLASDPTGRYKVVSGDSLHAIAKKTGVSVGQLRAANGLTDQSVIKVGQLLNVTKSTGGVAGDDGVDVAVTGKRKSNSATPNNTDATVTASIEPKQSKPKLVEAPSTNAAAAQSVALRWPAQGKVVTAFRGDDNGKPNDGIDIAMPAGTSVKAAEGGTVIYAGSGLAEFGNTVLIRHDNGLVTVYGHADKINVQRNQKVSKGDVIALSGASGRTKTPKLHFEVRKNSVPVDPQKYLQ